MATEIDLDDVMLSVEAAAAWQEMSQRVTLGLKQLLLRGREIDLEQIPDEQARIEDDGTLTIYLDIVDVLSVSMPVPANHWWRKQ